MIKRNGVEVMNARTKNVSIAKETIEICKNGSYTSLSGNKVDISVDLDMAKQFSVYYTEGVPANVTEVDEPITPVIEVTNETTTQAAQRLAGLGKQKIVALNFASARNQGGGFLSGALAQEEDLCRKSGLYTCLKGKPLFYNANILCDNCYYTDGVIYSPKVPFFRDEYDLVLENPYTLSIISAPAPNLNGVEKVDGKILTTTLAKRINKILEIAYINGHKNLVLGAWGCGAFGNDANMIATMFQAGLMLTPAFEHVCFAVYDRRDPPVIYETFKKVFE